MNTFKFTCIRMKRILFLLLIFYSSLKFTSAQTDSIVIQSCMNISNFGYDTTYSTEVDTFDLATGLLISHTEANSRTTYTYNQLGNIDTIKLYYPVNVLNGRIIYIYNIIDKDSIILHQNYTSGIWTNFSREVFNYDSQGNTLSKTQQTWSAGSWQTTKNFYYSYNGSQINNILELTVPGSDSTYNVYTYDSIGNYCITIIFYVQSLGVWDSVDGGYSCYNFRDQITSYHHGDGHAWYLYDSLGQIISITGQSSFQGIAQWSTDYNYNCLGVLSSSHYNYSSSQQQKGSTCNYYIGTSELFVAINPNQSICSGDTLNIEATLMVATSQVTYLWTPSTGLSSDTVLNPTVFIDSTTTYTFTATDSLGNTFSDCITITVKPNPDITIQALSPTSFCYGGTATMEATVANQGGWLIYSWYRDGQLYANPMGNSGYIYTDESGYYYVSIAASNGCQSISDSIYVFENVAAQAWIQPVGSYCLNDTAILAIHPNIDPNQNYQWMLNNVVIPGATDSILSVTQNGYYKVFVTSDTSACTNSTNNYNVTFSPPPTPNIIPDYDTAACRNTIFKLRTTYNPAWSYSYFINGIENNWSSSYHDSVSIVINNPIYVKIKTSNQGCIVITDSIFIDTFPQTNFAIQTSLNPPYCTGDTIQLASSIPTYLSYYWSTGSSNSTINVMNSGNYSVRITDINGCYARSDTSSIIFNSLPAIPVINHNVSLLFSSSADSMQWYFNGVAIAGAVDSTYTATQTGFYSYEVTNAFGCSAMSAPYYYSPTGIGISSPIINGVYIYPDLVTTSFTLYCDPGNKIKKLFFEIYNVGGQKIMEEKIEDGANLFQRQNLKPGMYFWRVVDANSHEELIEHGKIIFVD